MEKFDTLITEKRNQKSMKLDSMNTLSFITLMNDEDQLVVKAVQEILEDIEKVIIKTTEAIRNSGRLIYIGAGTSGRLGIIDAVECKPTFSTTDEVLAVIAGGEHAFIEAVEGAEDNETLAKNDLQDLKLTENDVVLAIAASGRTPYAIGALKYAKQLGSLAVGLSCNKGSQLSLYSDFIIEVEVGSEVITGSTRLKAGTATKMILNMISTATMVNLGKTYSNLMVDVKPTNYKLVERTKRIVMDATQCSYQEAEKMLKKSNLQPKIAILMILLNCTMEEAIERLARNPKIIDAIE